MTAGIAAVARCLADVIQSHSGVEVCIEQEVPALTRVVNGQSEHARMDLVFNLNGSVSIWMFLLLLLSLAIRPWSQQPAQNLDSWPRERRRPNLTGTHTSIWSRSSLRQLADLSLHARKFISYLMRETDNPHTSHQGHLVSYPKCAPQCRLKTPTLRPPLRDFRRSLPFPVSLVLTSC